MLFKAFDDNGAFDDLAENNLDDLASLATHNVDNKPGFARAVMKIFDAPIASGRWRHPYLRPMTVCGLLFFQLTVLWTATLHCHEILGKNSKVAIIVEGNRPLHSPAGSGLLCTFCLKFQHTDARPSTRAFTPQPLAAVSLLLAFSSRVIHSHEPAIPNGRAPPFPSGSSFSALA